MPQGRYLAVAWMVRAVSGGQTRAMLLRNAAFNRNRQVEDLRLYEIGPAFLPEGTRDAPVKEPMRVAAE